jgi:aromatic ring-opening dioxygenase catalytic subunit (LigB family)
MSSPPTHHPLPVTRPEWQDRLATLPGDHNHIPAFFFAHGSPILNISKDAPGLSNQLRIFAQYSGLESPFANFLRDFGPALLSKYQPKGILVFSAHWESEGEELGA